MKRFYFLIWSALLFANCTAYAQDQTNFAQFYLNPYLLNPSYAGIDGKPSVSFMYRKQWANIPDGPRIGNFTFHGPVTKRLSLGLSATNDVKGLLNNSGVLMTFGYTIPFDEHSFFRFGISGGGSWNTIDLDKLQGLNNDPALANLLNNNTSLNGNAGISIHLKSFHAGIALPVIFTPSYISRDAFNITEIKPFRTFNLHLSNRIYFNNYKSIFEPYVIYRMNLYDSVYLPSQFELAGIIHLNHVVWLGGSFKQDFGISALGGIKINNALAIGASYSLKNSGENELNSPTYEVAIGILFGKKKKEAPVYSFVDTHFEKVKKGTGLSASERIAEQRRQDELARKKQQDELAKKKQEEDLAKKQQAELAKKQQEETARKQQELASKQQTEPIVKTPTQTQTQSTPTESQQSTQTQTQQKQSTPTVVQQATTRKDTITVTHRPRFGHVETSTEILSSEITEHSQHDEQERIARLEEHAEDPDEHHEGGDHPNAERHEFVKRGGHAKELHVSDYVIGGVFGQEANATHFVSGLKKMGFNAGYGHLTEKNLWYVYLYQTEDINQARQERDRLRKMKMFRDAWLLTVHH